MSQNFDSRDPRYTIIEPGTDSDIDSASIIAVTQTIGRLFEMRALAAREEATRAIVEMESKERIGKFQQEMETLERRFGADERGAANREQSFFAIAHRLVDEGKDQAALAVLELISKEGRRSFVKDLIDYHEKITLGGVSMKNDSHQAS